MEAYFQKKNIYIRSLKNHSITYVSASGTYLDESGIKKYPRKKVQKKNQGVLINFNGFWWIFDQYSKIVIGDF